MGKFITLELYRRYAVLEPIGGVFAIATNPF